jgi:hypothetical protein
LEARPIFNRIVFLPLAFLVVELERSASLARLVLWVSWGAARREDAMSAAGGEAEEEAVSQNMYM